MQLGAVLGDRFVRGQPPTGNASAHVGKGKAAEAASRPLPLLPGVEIGLVARWRLCHLPHTPRKAAFVPVESKVSRGPRTDLARVVLHLVRSPWVWDLRRQLIGVIKCT